MEKGQPAPSGFEEFHEATIEQYTRDLMLMEAVFDCVPRYMLNDEGERFRQQVRADIARDWVNQVFCMIDMDGELITDTDTWERIKNLEQNFSYDASASQQRLNETVRYVAGTDSGIQKRNEILKGLHEAIEAGDGVIIDALVHMRVYAEQTDLLDEELHPNDIIEDQFQKYRELAGRYPPHQNNTDDEL